MTDKTSRIVIFDGGCNACSAAVDFIIRRDAKRRFHFAALQSEAGRRFSPRAPAGNESGGSIILYEDGRAFEKSEAVIRILRGLGGGWRALYVLRFVPAFIRDGIYSIIAQRRRRWFGMRTECRMLSPEERELFL